MELDYFPLIFLLLSEVTHKLEQVFMSSSCLESQGCHLIPLYNLRSHLCA